MSFELRNLQEISVCFKSVFKPGPQHVELDFLLGLSSD
jgi:hypothetical protein